MTTVTEAFEYFAEVLSKRYDLAVRVTDVYKFNIKQGKKTMTWTMDLTKREVYQGNVANPDCTLTAKEPDFQSLILGRENANAMYFNGKIKLIGDQNAQMRMFQVIRQMAVPSNL